jgi:4'-phosphopantetheinyl transferase
LLAGYLEVDPGDLDLCQDGNGKPRVVNPHSGALRFNLSHSEGLAVFAVARSKEVGIDLEYVRREFPVDVVAGRLFSPAEQQALKSLDTERRVEAFFAGWTLKEAYFKGLGVGWGTFDAGEHLPVDIRKVFKPRVFQYWSARRGQWSLAAFEAGAGFAAALAIEGENVRVPSAAQSLDSRLA